MNGWRDKILKKIKVPQIKARGPLLWWGRFRFMFAHAVFYVSMVSLVMLAATFYNTTLREWASLYFGFEMTFWMFCLGLVIVVVLGILVEFVISVPALIAVSNEQMYKHQSPIKTDFDEVKKKQAEQGKKLDKIIEHMGIKDDE